MTTTVDTPTGVIEQIGDGLREARRDVAGLKTHVMGMEDRLTERLDGMESKLDQIIERLGGLKFWVGSQAAYDALTADENTLYFTTAEPPT